MFQCRHSVGLVHSGEGDRQEENEFETGGGGEREKWRKSGGTGPSLAQAGSPLPPSSSVYTHRNFGQFHSSPFSRL